MASMQRALSSCLGDEFFQMSASIKFKIKKLESYCHWMLCLKKNLSEEQISYLKTTYLMLAEYYEKLTPIDLLKNRAQPSDTPCRPKEGLGASSIAHLLECYKAIQEVKQDMIMTRIPSDRVNFILMMSNLCREFVALLDMHLQHSTSLDLNTISQTVPCFIEQEACVHNEKLESLFRALET